MRAWQIVAQGSPGEALRLRETELPVPGPGFLRVRVAASALGLPDVFMCRGSYALTPKTPFTPGQELVGRVTAAGEGVHHRVGERIMGVSGFFLGHGGFAEEALVIDDFAFSAPESLPDAEAAGFLIPFQTAHVGLVRRAGLSPGETLLVLGGSGGTGSAAIQLGRALGARVLATAGSERKAEFCRSLGAELVVDPHRDDVAERVLEATAGSGAHVVYDPVGGEAFAAATRCVAPEGRILAVGFASGQWGRPDPAHMVTRNYAVIGVMPGAYDRAQKARVQDAFLAHHARGEIRVPVDRVAPFETLPEALDALADGRVLGKSVLSVGGAAAYSA